MLRELVSLTKHEFHPSFNLFLYSVIPFGAWNAGRVF